MKSNKKLDIKGRSIIDRTNCMMLLPFVEDDEKGLIVPEGFVTGHFKWKITNWEDVSLNVDKTAYKTKLNKFGYDFVEQFKKIASAFYEKRITDTTEFILYECRENYPVVLAYGNIAMLLAPRVDSE